jgi:hypothetical protein
MELLVPVRRQAFMKISGIPLRYAIPPYTVESRYTQDLDIEANAMRWRDAIEFVFAGSEGGSVNEFWALVREEYLRSGGELKPEGYQEVVFD